MKVSSSWINEYLTGASLEPARVIEALERAGMEVEEVLRTQALDPNIVVAQIKSAEKHPNADRLNLTTVTDGSAEFQVVCGAPNARVGLKVALARVGSKLPQGEEIGKAKLRGVISEGMLCSEAELGLGHDHNGILELPDDAQLGVQLASFYPGDEIIDLKTPANRFDVQSVYGLAREVSAFAEKPLADLQLSELSIQKPGTIVSATITGSRRYILAKVSAKDSAVPESVIAKIRSAGMRSVSPIVDITNYVMLETGQPLHAFDAKKVRVPVAVRWAMKGERLVTLDGVERVLTTEDLVIADATGPIALAGIMGGQSTEVDNSTTEILLESATFDAVTVRKTAKRQGLRTEASSRMERSIPTELPEIGMSRALGLLQQFANAGNPHIEEAREAQGAASVAIKLPMSLLIKLLGFELPATQAVGALKRLHIVAVEHNHVIQVAAMPWWRPDLKLAEDLIEEIVRIIGYDKVPATLPAWRPNDIKFDRLRSVKRLVREVLYGAGLFEVMTYSFSSEEQLKRFAHSLASHLKLKNPLNSEQAYLRSSLLPNHMGVLQANRVYSKNMAFYEISRVFLKGANGADLPEEPEMLGLTLQADGDALAKMRGLVEALTGSLSVDFQVVGTDSPNYLTGRFGKIMVAGRQVGTIGLVNPALSRQFKVTAEVAHAELALDELISRARPAQYQPIHRFPIIERDITLPVPADATWQSIIGALGEHHVVYLSEYHGESLPAGVKNVTFRLEVSEPDRTPTEEEANRQEARVRSQLYRKFKTSAK